jgi:hypothetical protein
MTMTTMKTLMLAAFAALTLGAGTAMAQDGGGGGMDYWSRQNMKAIQQGGMQANRTTPVPSGSSDVDTIERGSAHSAEYIFNHHLYGASGVAG